MSHGRFRKSSPTRILRRERRLPLLPATSDRARFIVREERKRTETAIIRPRLHFRVRLSNFSPFFFFSFVLFVFRGESLSSSRTSSQGSSGKRISSRFDAIIGEKERTGTVNRRERKHGNLITRPSVIKLCVLVCIEFSMPVSRSWQVKNPSLDESRNFCSFCLRKRSISDLKRKIGGKFRFCC